MKYGTIRLGGWAVAFIMLLVCCTAAAGPRFSLPDCNGIAGSHFVLPISIEGVDEASAGLNATLSLPAGIICEASTKGALTDGYWSVQGDGTGTVTIVVWSATDVFQANRGVVFELGMTVASNAVPGTYPLAFSRTGLSNADGSQSLPHSTSNGWLMIDVDSDNDGCGDNWEITEFGSLTNVTLSSDSDGDGLLDQDEFSANTNPHNSDSDGDGMPDPAELVAGTDPNNPADVLLAYIGTPSGTGSSVVVEWDSVAAKRYAILESSNLVSGVWTNIHQTWGHGSARAYTMTNLPSSSFFKIQVVD